MATTPRDRSRYFVIDFEDDKLLYTPDAIIEAILSRYPTVNFIRIRGQLGWKKKCVKVSKDGKSDKWEAANDFSWKHIWIQQSKNALNKDCLIKNLLKDLPGITEDKVRKIELDSPDIKDTNTQFIKIWGSFHTPAKDKSAKMEPTLITLTKRIVDMTDDEKNQTISQQSDAIIQLMQENARLKETAVTSTGSIVNVNSPSVNSNNINSNNVSIVVNMANNPHGFESHDHISKEEWKSFVTAGVQEGLAQLAYQTMGKLHSIDENKNFYMTHAGAENVKVLRHGNVYEDVLLTTFAQDAPYHYAEIVKEASTENASTINTLKKNWAANRNRKLSNQKMMRKVQKIALDANPSSQEENMDVIES